MTQLDWWVLVLYLLSMFALAIYLGRKQQSRKDYFLASQGMPSWALATSIIATQCSTNSLLGAPAFVGFVLGGGLIWLQYELAVPLAMLFLCYFFLPIRKAGVISIYAFLEKQLGLESRLVASACFLFFRGIATGVTAYGVAVIVEMISGLPFIYGVLILMGMTIAYDLLGGMKAVVISDVIQMLLLLGAVFAALVWLFPSLSAHFDALGSRTDVFVNNWGLNVDGDARNNYGFWPMLIGGFFLYAAYYGCDQSQAQRLLSAPSAAKTQQVLLLNGLLRFPLVLAYCVLGLGLAAYAVEYDGFIQSLPLMENGSPNYNMVFPSFVLSEFPAGLRGLIIVGLFAAAMSSIDSALNSLSASTIEDYVQRFKPLTEKQLFLYSKIATLAWGLFAIVFSFQVEAIAPTILETINKVGSMANGPLLGLFAIAVFLPSIGQRRALVGFVAGLSVNIGCWLLVPSLSWLWWNVIGLVVCLVCACLGLKLNASSGITLRASLTANKPASSIQWLLMFAFSLILMVGALFQFLA